MILQNNIVSLYVIMTNVLSLRSIYSFNSLLGKTEFNASAVPEGQLRQLLLGLFDGKLLLPLPL